MFVGLGVDIVDIPRARRMLDTYGDRILARVCTAAEAAYVRSHVDGAQHLAVRLAAKEATFKALAGSVDARTIGWREIEVISADGGPPGLMLHGRAQSRLSELGATGALLSLSHGDAVAIAVVLIQGTSQPV
jgi:holo-[acyl-carrier protein] synthase